MAFVGNNSGEQIDSIAGSPRGFDGYLSVRLRETNIQGEMQQKLDIYADETLIKCFSDRESIGVIASEENEHPILLSTSPEAQYAIVFDPLDGSSNIDIAVTIGTTFSIFRASRKCGCQ